MEYAAVFYRIRAGLNRDQVGLAYVNALCGVPEWNTVSRSTTRVFSEAYALTPVLRTRSGLLFVF